MKNITINGNSVKRIYVNNKLITTLSYGNQNVLFYRTPSDWDSDVLNDYYTLETRELSGFQSTATCSHLGVNSRGWVKLKSKYISDSINYSFDDIITSDYMMHYVFELSGIANIAIESYRAYTEIYYSEKGYNAVYTTQSTPDYIRIDLVDGIVEVTVGFSNGATYYDNSRTYTPQQKASAQAIISIDGTDNTSEDRYVYEISGGCHLSNLYKV